MALPKGFIKNMRIAPQKQGPARRQELLDEVNNNGPFLPRGVEIEDMDKAFIDFVKTNLELTLEGEKVPVFFLTIQRWAELTQTWDFTDKFKDLKMPFISIVRKPDVQEGTNQIGLWNIPGHPTYTYMKVPTFEGGRKGIDVYKIPQPTCIDINYEVRLFCNRMADLNKFMSKMERAFSARQAYISANGHYMPLVKEGQSDESPVEDLENRRFYVNLTEILLQGYILSEEEFEVIPTANRAIMFTELAGQKYRPTYQVKQENNIAIYEFIFTCDNLNEITFTSTENVNISNIIDRVNLTYIYIEVNGGAVTLPFDMLKNDVVKIIITREDNEMETKFKLVGYEE